MANSMILREKDGTVDPAQHEIYDVPTGEGPKTPDLDVGGGQSTDGCGPTDMKGPTSPGGGSKDSEESMCGFHCAGGERSDEKSHKKLNLLTFQPTMIEDGGQKEIELTLRITHKCPCNGSGGKSRGAVLEVENLGGTSVMMEGNYFPKAFSNVVVACGDITWSRPQTMELCANLLGIRTAEILAAPFCGYIDRMEDILKPMGLLLFQNFVGDPIDLGVIWKEIAKLRTPSEVLKRGFIFLKDYYDKCMAVPNGNYGVSFIHLASQLDAVLQTSQAIMWKRSSDGKGLTADGTLGQMMQARHGMEILGDGVYGMIAESEMVGLYRSGKNVETFLGENFSTESSQVFDARYAINMGGSQMEMGYGSDGRFVVVPRGRDKARWTENLPEPPLVLLSDEDAHQETREKVNSAMRQVKRGQQE